MFDWVYDASRAYGSGLEASLYFGNCVKLILLNKFALNECAPHDPLVTRPGGNLVAGVSMGLRARFKKLIVGVMGNCTSSCALIWIGAEAGRKFLYHSRPIALTALCFHQASQHALLDRFGHLSPGPTSGEGNALIAKYLATLGYNQDMIEWALTAGPTQRLCLTRTRSEI